MGHMTDAYFFGYGSLVNQATHGYPDVTATEITGWKRHWRQIDAFPRAILTAVPAPQSRLEGLIARVPDNDWAALDLRERAYDRVPLAPAQRLGAFSTLDLAIYEIPAQKHPAPDRLRPIALSYLDVVVQGYFRVFGEAGVARFFATTTGWEAPILDDRSAPLYPRAQRLTKAETALVDHYLVHLAA